MRIITVFAAVFMATILSTASGQDTTSPEVAAIYFPSYHRDPHYDSWFGEGWDEWKLMADAPSRFDGHRILAPEWGPFDEADPKWMQRQIALAADHEIDVFIFDWYWYSGVQILHRALEEGFLKSQNRARLKFSLMWANHDWADIFPSPYETSQTILLPIRHSKEDFARVMDYCLKHYFKEPNYWRVNGGLYFSFFQPELFMKQLGGPEKTREALDAARKLVADAGLGTMHFGAFIYKPDNIEKLKQAGFDSITSYNHTSSGKASLPAKPLDQYEDVAASHVDFWKRMDTGALPYFPIATTGWDTTPRWEKNVEFPPTRSFYPYTPIVVGSTPERFGKLVSDAFDQAAAAKIKSPAIILNAWNEWTEGCVLLPEKVYKTGYLDALTSAVRARRSR